jgi:hypothetical protein
MLAEGLSVLADLATVVALVAPVAWAVFKKLPGINIFYYLVGALSTLTAALKKLFGLGNFQGLESHFKKIFRYTRLVYPLKKLDELRFSQLRSLQKKSSDVSLPYLLSLGVEAVVHFKKTFDITYCDTAPYKKTHLVQAVL